MAVNSGLLIRLAALCIIWAIYYSPQHFFTSVRLDNETRPSKVAEVRLWLTFLVTIVSMMGMISTPLVLVSCIHGGLHVIKWLTNTPDHNPTSQHTWCLNGNDIDTCTFEYTTLVTFLLILLYVLFPPSTSLSVLERHRYQLKKYFKQYDRENLSLADKLLEEYVGNERLLFAYIRRIINNQASQSA